MEEAPPGQQQLFAPPRRTGAAQIGFYLSAVLVGVFLVRLLGEPWNTHFPAKFPDALNPGRADTYFAVARLTPFRPAFYWAPRPFVYPAVLWVFGRSTHIVVIAQTLAYCGATVLLCVTALKVLRSRVIAGASVVAFVLIGIQARFALWNTQILTESLGMALGLVAVAAWWRVVAAPSARGVTWAWAATIVWLLERDAQVVPVVLVLIPAATAVAVVSGGLESGVRRRLLVGAGVTLLACVYVFAAQQVSHRDRVPFDNNIGMRVLPDRSLRAWFIQRGMPYDVALAARQGKDAFADGRAFRTDPALARYRRWADGAGGRWMALSLVLRAPDWNRLQNKQWGSLLAEDYGAYDSYGAGDRLPKRIPFQLAGPGTRRGLLIWGLLASGFLAGAAVFTRRSVVLAFAGGTLAFALVDVYGSFAGDAFEISRHVVGPLQRLSIALVVCIAVSADKLWQQYRATGT